MSDYEDFGANRIGREVRAAVKLLAVFLFVWLLNKYGVPWMFG